MTVRERILTLKLLELQARHPAYTNRIGIQVTLLTQDPKEAQKDV